MLYEVVTHPQTAAVCEHWPPKHHSELFFFLIDDRTLFKLHTARRDPELTNIRQPTAERNPPSQVKSRFELLTRRRAHMLRQMGKQNNSPFLFFLFLVFVFTHLVQSVTLLLVVAQMLLTQTHTQVFSLLWTEFSPERKLKVSCVLSYLIMILTVS